MASWRYHGDSDCNITHRIFFLADSLTISYPDNTWLKILGVRHVVLGGILCNLVFSIKALIASFTSFSLFDSDGRRVASPHPAPGSTEPRLCPGATRSQSPQADSPISYLSLGIVIGNPSENISLYYLHKNTGGEEFSMRWVEMKMLSAGARNKEKLEWRWAGFPFYDFKYCYQNSRPLLKSK